MNWTEPCRAPSVTLVLEEILDVGLKVGFNSTAVTMVTGQLAVVQAHRWCLVLQL